MKKLLFAISALLTASWTMPATVQAEQVHPQTFVTTDITDLWYNALESGYGLQVDQTGNFVFVTIFIYGADSKPTWVTAQLTYVGGFAFAGPVYATTGSYYGLPTFTPGTTTPVGTMTFIVDSITTAHIVFSISGVVVTKNIQRQPLGLENISGSYTGSVNLTASACTSPASDASANLGFNLNFTQVGSAISGSFQLVGTTPGVICPITGTISEAGRIQATATSFACPTGDAGTFNFIEVTNRIGILTGRISGASTTNGCAYSGRFAVVNPLVP